MLNLENSNQLLSDREAAPAHFQLVLYAVIARILATLRKVEDQDFFARFPFLASYEAMLKELLPEEGGGDNLETGWFKIYREWELSRTGHLPLKALEEEVGPGEEAGFLVIAAGLVEEDVRFGSLFAALQEPLVARRPCLGTLGWLLNIDTPVNWPLCRALIENGFLVVENKGSPRVEWVLKVPHPIWDALKGQPQPEPVPGLLYQLSDTFRGFENLIVPDPLRRQLSSLPDLLSKGRVSALIVRGMSGSGRRTVLGTVALALGKDVLLWEGEAPGDEAWQVLGPLATLSGALPLLRCNPGPGETLELPPLPGYKGPFGLTLGKSGGVKGPLVAHSVSVTIPLPEPDARLKVWQALNGSVATAEMEEIAVHYLLPCGTIWRTGELAYTYAAMEGRVSITLSDVLEASRSLNRQSLETLATPLPPAHGWDDLVVGEALENELRILEARCRNRERLSRNSGPAFNSSLNLGVRALFSGPSGTGKTLAARTLAAVLEKDLYRVDLAAVVSKYIGETERNLNQVLSRAEELDVILLLDEGDALMTGRTEVTSANDRYANLETNYLLQRLESYEGIVIVTSNAAKRIDTAFLRRIDVTIEFTPPDAAERLLIWQHHLPRDHSVTRAKLEEVSARCSLSGGQIRNAALLATLLAIRENARVGDKHLLVALQREYRKAGATYPLREAVSLF